MAARKGQVVAAGLEPGHLGVECLLPRDEIPGEALRITVFGSVLEVIEGSILGIEEFSVTLEEPVVDRLAHVESSRSDGARRRPDLLLGSLEVLSGGCLVGEEARCLSVADAGQSGWTAASATLRLVRFKILRPSQATGS